MGNLSVTAFYPVPIWDILKRGLNFASQIPKAGRVLSLTLLVCSQELTGLMNGETATPYEM